VSGLRTAYDLEALAALLDGLAPWLTVRTAPKVPGPEWISCAATLSAQLAGEDPTASWRAVLASEYGRQYRIDPPRQVAAMFVLMWYVGVPARIASASSALTGYAPDVSPERIAFRLHPTQHYPAEVALLPGPVLPAVEAAAASDEHCRAFVDSYRSGVKLGSRQRYGAIADEYRTAIKACAGSPYASQAARVFGVDPGVTVRDSCCFIYALPGVTACSTCPRLR
jgi:FhuF 2Fe-2S C-terminal domain